MKKTADHNDNSVINDEVLMQFFDAKEAGKSFPDALLSAGITDTSIDLAEFHALWDMHGDFMREAHNISPSRSLLERTITALPRVAPSAVTSSSSTGYHKESSQNIFIRIIHNLDTMSQMNWKIVAPIAVFVLAVVAVVNVGGSRNPAKLAGGDANAPEAVLMDAGAPVAEVSPIARGVAPVSATLSKSVASAPVTLVSHH
jgi:hypothetical protein